MSWAQEWRLPPCPRANDRVHGIPKPTAGERLGLLLAYGVETTAYRRGLTALPTRCRHCGLAMLRAQFVLDAIARIKSSGQASGS